jgi:nicotinamide-nucleotide amidase
VTPSPAGLPPGTAGSAAGAESLAAEIIELLTARRQTVAVAESLTGGLVAAALTSVAGSSLAFRGGVVAYATPLKASLLGVSERLLAEQGPVDGEVAVEMAAGVASRLGATFGLATTGVAGPGPADGHPAGTVFVALATAGQGTAYGLRLTGGRAEVRAASVTSVLSLLVSELREDISRLQRYVTVNTQLCPLPHGQLGQVR